MFFFDCGSYEVRLRLPLKLRFLRLLISSPSYSISKQFCSFILGWHGFSPLRILLSHARAGKAFNRVAIAKFGSICNPVESFMATIIGAYKAEQIRGGKPESYYRHRGNQD